MLAQSCDSCYPAHYFKSTESRCLRTIFRGTRRWLVGPLRHWVKMSSSSSSSSSCKRASAALDEGADAAAVAAPATTFTLPLTCWALALSFLDWAERLACGTVSRTWRAAVDSPTAWRGFALVSVSVPPRANLLTWLSQWVGRRPLAARGLTRLELNGWRVQLTADTLASFRALTSLQLDQAWLYTDDSGFTGLTQVLPSLPILRKLSLFRWSVPTCCVTVSQCSRLTHLEFAWCEHVTDEALRLFGALSALQRLTCFHCHAFTGAGLAHLPPTLQWLDMTNCSHLEALPLHLPRLRQLVVSAPSPLLSDTGLQRLVPSETLRELVLDGAPLVTDRALSTMLSGFPGLWLLSLGGLSCSGECLSALSGCVRLSALTVTRWSPLRAERLAAAVTCHCHSLHTLHVVACEHVEFGTLRDLLSSKPVTLYWH